MLALLNHAVIKLESSVGIVSSVSDLGLLDHFIFLGFVGVDDKTRSLPHLLRVEGVLVLYLEEKIRTKKQTKANCALLRRYRLSQVTSLDGVVLSDSFKVHSETYLVSYWWEALHEEFSLHIAFSFLKFSKTSC